MTKKILKCDVTCSWIPSPVTNCHTFSDPLPPSSVTYFMDGPITVAASVGYVVLSKIERCNWSKCFVFLHLMQMSPTDIQASCIAGKMHWDQNVSIQNDIANETSFQARN